MQDKTYIMTSNVRRNEVKKTKLNFRFHNPNPPEAFAEVLLRIMIDANGPRVERIIQEELCITSDNVNTKNDATAKETR